MVQLACGFLLYQGLNLCPLHWQVDSYPTDMFRTPAWAPKLVFVVADTRSTCGVLAPPAMGFPLSQHSELLLVQPLSRVQLFATL